MASAAERRQLTIMFSDMVGSTELSGLLDPEDFHDLLRRYQDLAADELDRFGGSIAYAQGDGIVAYFGFPLAHEDDAERAILAALGLVRGAAPIATEDGRSIAVRVAVATGPVLVGELVGAAFPQRDAIIGETTNLAARLQSIAAPGTVIVDGLTRELAGDHFLYEALGPHHLKGFDRPIEAWRPVAQRLVESRFKALRRSPLTRFVGREHELAQLRRAWNEAMSGRGRAIGVKGEAGIGKSRLTTEFAQSVVGEGARYLLYQCSSIHSNSPLYPVIQRIEQAAGIQPQDSLTERSEKLRDDVLALTPGEDVSVALFAELLGLRIADGAPTAQLTPREKRELVFAALMRRLRAIAARGPLLIMLEDIHWADASTLELVDRAIGEIADLRALMILTFRPDFQPGAMTISATIGLGRLAHEDCRTIFREIAGDGSEDLQEIILITDGNPLYVEEVSAALLAPTTPAGNPARGSREPIRAKVPRTLQATFNARLDRLNGGKLVAQFAAALGRDFSVDLIRATWPFEPDKLDAGFTRLHDDDIIRPIFGRESHQFSFKHALLQEAAYQSLLKRDRQFFHRQIALRLESDFPGLCSSQPELLATHHEAAGDPDKALDYLQVAVLQAISRSAYVEAANHLQRMQRLLGQGPSGLERDRRDLQIQLLLSNVQTATRGYPDREFGATCERAVELSRQAGTSHERYLALLGLWRHRIACARMKAATDLVKPLLDLSATVGTASLQLTAHATAGITACCRGQFEAAEDHLRRAKVIYDAQTDPQLADQFGQDSGVAGYTWYTKVAWLRGRFKLARRLCDQTRRLAKATRHPFTAAYTLQRLAVLAHMREDYERMEDLVIELTEVVTRHDFPYFGPMIQLHRSLLPGAEADPRAALAEAQAALAIFEERESRLFRGYLTAGVAQLAMRLGEWELAHQALDQALDCSRDTGETWYLAEIWRLGALCKAAAGNQSQAEASLAAGRIVAQEQGASALELRLSLAAMELPSKPALARHRRDELRGLLSANDDDDGEPLVRQARLALSGP